MATILVVDDEFGIAELFDAILADEGHRVLMASNGRNGLEMLAATPADLIFLDFMMPVMDGSGMLRQLAANPALSRIPVVMMSSIPQATVAERCRGYAVFLRKPFSIDEVVHVTHKLLNGAGPT